MKLFQYWDTGDPPDDVAACIASAREYNSEMDHRLFDQDSGAHFLGKYVGPRERKVFLTLAVPAMQADYLRLGVLWAKGGIWNDADNLSVAPFRTLIEQAPGGYISMLANLLQTDLLFVPKAGSPFFRACLELATRHIEARMVGDATEVTGPGVLNLLWAAVDSKGAHEDPHRARDPALSPTAEARAVAALYPDAGMAFAQLERRHDIWTGQWVKTSIPAYKSTPKDWRRWRGPIYRRRYTSQI